MNEDIARCSSEFRTSDLISGSTGRYGATGTVLKDGRIAFIGGEALVDPISNRMELFNPNQMVWNQGSSLNYGRAYHTSTLLTNGNILVTGGYDNIDLIATAERFNLLTNTWGYVAPMNQQRALHKAVLLSDGRVLVVGANSNQIAANGAEFYNPNQNTWTQTGGMNSFRSSGLTLTLLNDGRALVVGGFGVSGIGVGENLSSVEIFDPNTNQWILRTPLNQPRFAHSSILLSDGRVLVAGGKYMGSDNSNSYLDSMEIYDPVANVWKLLKMPVSRSEFTLERISDGSILFIGGRNQTYVNNNYRYFPDTDRWCSIATLQKSRDGHLSNVLPDGSILIYGGAGLNGYEDATERLR
ncbi:kelch repeat protein [Leptospira alstonii serovar Pingchang str. 80-412]|uniref:Kelch repeat protein n=2 Tax=Leptospira alstonii TaxID=28452 RepID=M6CYY4_9LEPT|nr:kelch repeat protein [Leptospira alstonii serovar Sichuan str. 79601]EQA78408.1 kelch repeat protein [Leptospira alstonii serovar Pingchang str. 80-412]